MPQVDSFYARFQQHSTRVAGENAGIGLTKGAKKQDACWSLIHLVFRSKSLSLRGPSLIAHKFDLIEGRKANDFRADCN